MQPLHAVGYHGYTEEPVSPVLTAGARPLDRSVGTARRSSGGDSSSWKAPPAPPPAALMPPPPPLHFHPAAALAAVSMLTGPQEADLQQQELGLRGGAARKDSKDDRCPRGGSATSLRLPRLRPVAAAPDGGESQAAVAAGQARGSNGGVLATAAAAPDEGQVQLWAPPLAHLSAGFRPLLADDLQRRLCETSGEASKRRHSLGEAAPAGFRPLPGAPCQRARSSLPMEWASGRHQGGSSNGLLDSTGDGGSAAGRDLAGTGRGDHSAFRRLFASLPADFRGAVPLAATGGPLCSGSVCGSIREGGTGGGGASGGALFAAAVAALHAGGAAEPTAATCRLSPPRNSSAACAATPGELRGDGSSRPRARQLSPHGQPSTAQPPLSPPASGRGSAPKAPPPASRGSASGVSDAAHPEPAASDDCDGPSAVTAPAAAEDGTARVLALSDPTVDGNISGSGKKGSIGRTGSSSRGLQAAVPVLHSFRSDSGQSAETATAVLAAMRPPGGNAAAVAVRCSAMVAAPSSGKRQLDRTTSSFRRTHDCKRVKA